MTTVYLLDATPLLDAAQRQRCLSYLSPRRRQTLARLRSAEQQAQSVGAGLLLYRLFGPADYIYGPHGKPTLRDARAHFSLSHSGHWVVCAVSDSPVGVDIQPPSLPRPALLRRCFTQEERAYSGESPARFARLWSMKEAYLKLSGAGRSAGAQSVALALPPAPGFDASAGVHWAFPAFADCPAAISLCQQEKHPLTLRVVGYPNLL